MLPLRNFGSRIRPFGTRSFTALLAGAGVVASLLAVMILVGAPVRAAAAPVHPRSLPEVSGTLAIVSDVSSISQSGEEISFTITVSNRGGDSFVPPLSASVNGVDLLLSDPTGDSNQNGILDAGESWSYTTSYQADQDDIEAGTQLVGRACAGDLDGDGSEDCAIAIVALSPDEAISIVKTVDVDTYTTVGDIVTYTVTLINLGDISTVPEVTDHLNGVSMPLGDPSGDRDDDGRLDVDETWTYTVAYTVTADDVASGQPLVNVACAVVRDTIQCWSAQVDKAIEPEARFELSKTFNQASVAPGETGSFQLAISNTSETELHAVQLVDVVDERLTVTGVSDSACSPEQILRCTVSLDVRETREITVEFVANPYLPSGQSFETTNGAAFQFEFANGYILEGASDQQATLTDADGNLVQQLSGRKRNDFVWLTPEGESINIHLSCSTPYLDGFNEQWTITSYSIWRFRKGTMFRGCGGILQAIAIRNTASASVGDARLEANDAVIIESHQFSTVPGRRD